MELLAQKAIEISIGQAVVNVAIDSSDVAGGIGQCRLSISLIALLLTDGKAHAAVSAKQS